MNPPYLVMTDNLSIAWAKTFLLASTCKKDNFSSALISITLENSTFAEDSTIRRMLEGTYSSLNKAPKNAKRKNPKYVSIRNNAATIFPKSLWKPIEQKGYHYFFRFYNSSVFPALKKSDQRNKFGTYFSRMSPQLEILLDFWNKEQKRNSRARRSALQASCSNPKLDNGFFMAPILDPEKDLTPSRVRGFPCLQQVSFCWNNNNELSLTAFYPTQYIFDRAYGNYLGLLNLGLFMAKQMDLTFTNLNCYVNSIQTGSASKRDLKDLTLNLEGYISKATAGEDSWNKF